MEVNISLSVEILVEVSRLIMIKYPKASALNLGSRGQSSLPVR